jgi:hypothetical protein
VHCAAGVERARAPREAVIPEVVRGGPPSATRSTPAPVGLGPRLEKSLTSLSVTWAMRAIESKPVAPNCVEEPTLMPADGAGAMFVP